MCIPMGNSLLAYTLVGQVALETLVGVVKLVDTLIGWVDRDNPVEMIGIGVLIALTELVAALVEQIATVVVLTFPVGDLMLMIGTHESLC